jgi:hypothetical protein
MGERIMSGRWKPNRPAWIGAALCLALASTWGSSAGAQSCPSAYAACDNGGCCLGSERCCPTLAEGCCGPETPFCCGDGTCAASPAECANVGRNTCSGYDGPCGGGCVPAGSQCCDLAGHYCAPQGICLSETTCRAGEVDSVAKLVLSTSMPSSPSGPARAPSPLVDPADGTERSCVLAPGRGGHVRGELPLFLLALGAMAAARRAQAARRHTPG